MTPFIKFIFRRKITFTPFIMFFAALIVSGGQGGTAHSALKVLANDEMEGVICQSGIGIAYKNIQIFQNIEKFRYCATDNGYLELQNIQVDTLKLNYDFGTITDSGLMFFDVGTPEVASQDDWDLNTDPTSEYRVLTRLSVPNWDQDLTYTIQNLAFSDGTAANTYDLGQIALGSIDIPTYQYFTSPRHTTKTGVDWEYNFEAHIDKFEYAYRIDPPNCQSISFNNIHIGNSFGFGTAGDDPRDPATWTSNIGKYQIGDIFGDLAANEHSRPAQFDVGVTDISGQDNIATRLRLPMSGSIRFEKVEYGGIDFGPGAIDGIEVYRFNAYLIP